MSIPNGSSVLFRNSDSENCPIWVSRWLVCPGVVSNTYHWLRMLGFDIGAHSTNQYRLDSVVIVDFNGPNYMVLVRHFNQTPVFGG